MKKLIILLIIPILLSGCASIPVTQSSYNYNQDINNIWSMIKNLSLKNSYSYLICSSSETNQPDIPEIKGTQIYLPQRFVNYVYQYYYNNRNEIFVCIFLHEISHKELNLPDKPIEVHYLVDKNAVCLLPPPYGVNDYYNFLIVLNKYGDSVKGIGKHLFNTAWNTINAATYLYAGFGSFGDWFTYDVSSRILLLYKEYKLDYRNINFKRSSFSRTISK